ncbi:complex I 24 kDa subunit family protein, partial [Thermobrachium celere]|uniref:NADH-quinone oxidoreductase subunit NuoE family protein n=1 Tax=Thermobrachium celere TaxID=53422 RepID=UPI001FA80AD5
MPSLSRLMKDGIGEGYTRADHPDVANQIFSSYSKVQEVKALSQVIREDELSEIDKKYLEFGKKLNIPAAKVYGVATFYSYFTMEPRGKHVINVCMGTACFVKGADKVLEEIKKQLNITEGNMSPDGMFTVDSLRCVGACGLAPVVMVDGKVYGRVKVEDVKSILD